MDVIGYQGAVLGLVLADEPVLHAVICKFQPDGIVNILPQGGSLVPGIDGAVGAVSYTHLDVYKRQSLHHRTKEIAYGYL